MTIGSCLWIPAGVIHRHESSASLDEGADDLGNRERERLRVLQDHERTRLLQEEIASRLGEATNRNLFVLSVLTATFLPVTLITGIFGMNVGGLPGLHGDHAFWWVMLLILASGAATLAAFFWRRLL